MKNFEQVIYSQKDREPFFLQFLKIYYYGIRYI